MAFGVLFMQAGLTEDIVQKISDEKDDPVWMREFRMKSLQIYRQMQIPDWGPPIDGLAVAQTLYLSFLELILEISSSGECSPYITIIRLGGYNLT